MQSNARSNVALLSHAIETVFTEASEGDWVERETARARRHRPREVSTKSNKSECPAAKYPTAPAIFPEENFAENPAASPGAEGILRARRRSCPAFRNLWE